MLKSFEPNGHASDCPKTERNEPCADSKGTHTDIFCDGCHGWFDEPHVLPNGTDVAWPSGWTEHQAQAWRREHNLARPAVNINELSRAGTGMLPDPESPDQSDMAPSG